MEKPAGGGDGDEEDLGEPLDTPTTEEAAATPAWLTCDEQGESEG